MYYPTYEKQLIKAYNKTDLYQLLSVELAMTLMDAHQQFRRGLSVKQVINVLTTAMKQQGANYESIQLALNETQPTGVRHDA
jgi:hypothetical protein